MSENNRPDGAQDVDLTDLIQNQEKLGSMVLALTEKVDAQTDDQVSIKDLASKLGAMDELLKNMPATTPTPAATIEPDEDPERIVSLAEMRAELGKQKAEFEKTLELERQRPIREANEKIMRLSAPTYAEVDGTKDFDRFLDTPTGEFGMTYRDAQDKILESNDYSGLEKIATQYRETLTKEPEPLGTSREYSRPPAPVESREELQAKFDTYYNSDDPRDLDKAQDIMDKIKSLPHDQTET